jgi:hypothetical protein
MFLQTSHSWREERRKVERLVVEARKERRDQKGESRREQTGKRLHDLEFLAAQTSEMDPR